jgi:hypothetical protein
VESVAWGNGRVDIGRLTVRARGEASSAAPVLRLRAERLLNAIDLRPPGMPSGAMLIVRELRGQALMTPGSLLPRGWTEQVCERVAELYRTAARPSRGPASENARSVLFADGAELLVCLTRDVLVGRARHVWYWQQVLPRSSFSSSDNVLASIWAEHPACLPTALATLSLDEAIAGVGQLGPRGTRAVVRALDACFGLPPTVFQVSISSAPDTASQSHRSHGVEHAAAVQPWGSWLPPTAAPRLDAEARYLLGLGLTLNYAPSLARTAWFAQRSEAWLAAPSSATRSVSQIAGPDRPAASPSEGLDAVAARLTRAENGITHQVQIDGFDRAPRLGGMADAAWEDPASAPDTAETPGAGAPLAALDSAPGRPASAIVARRADAAVGAEDEGWPKPGILPPADGVVTNLGGVLYLINLLVWLDLPQSWDAEGAMAMGLGGWGTLEALARGLLGPVHARYRDDPIWSALSILSGRGPGTRLGHEMVVPNAFRLPPPWLRRFAPADARWIAAPVGRRVRLADAATGYLVADVPSRGRPLDDVASRVVAEYRASGVEAGWQIGVIRPLAPLQPSMAECLAPAVRWWLVRVRGFIASALVGALRAEDETVADALLVGAGRLDVSRTHIDLHLPLDSIRTPVRRAGLDQDPGWVPDLGRVVLFHFT